MWDHSREAFDHASLVLPAISDTAGSLSSARSLRTPNGMVAEVCRLYTSSTKKNKPSVFLELVETSRWRVRLSFRLSCVFVTVSRLAIVVVVVWCVGW